MPQGSDRFSFRGRARENRQSERTTTARQRENEMKLRHGFVREKNVASLITSIVRTRVYTAYAARSTRCENHSIACVAVLASTPKGERCAIPSSSKE